MKELKFGIIGTGMISGMFVEALREVRDTSVTAVLSRKRETGEEFVSRYFGGSVLRPAVVTDVKELFLSNVNAIYIAAPNRFHSELSIEAMKAGFDVLCEKPIASNSAECKEMFSVSEKTGKVLLEAMRPAFDPAYDSVLQAINEIGIIRHVSFEYCQYSSRYDRFKNGEYTRAFDPSYSNAAVMDIGIYPIYVCLMLFGKPNGMVCAYSTIFDNGMEGGGEAILKYNGMNAVISYSKICDSLNPSVIIGEKGSISIDKLSSPSVVLLSKKEKTDSEVIYSSAKSNNMRFEVMKFKELVTNRDVEHKYAAISRISMEMTDRIRRENGIVFEADK